MEDTICPISLLRLVKELLQKYTILSNFSLQIHVAKQAIKELGFIDHQWTMHVNDISSELNNVDFDVSLVISGQRWQNCPDTLAFDKSSNSRYMKHFLQLKPPSYRAHESSSLAGSYFFFKWEKNARFPVPIPDPHFTRGWWGREETNQDSLAVISSPNERKMADALSPSQIQILLGDGKAEKKPIRNELLLREPSTSFNLTLFTRQKTVINWRFNIRSNFPNESENVATATIPDARWPNNYCSYSKEHTFQNWA